MAIQALGVALLLLVHRSSSTSTSSTSSSSGRSSVAGAASPPRHYPVPTALPPHAWDSVGHKLFIHGCKKEGLFNTSELALAAKYPLMTVEKGQGLDLPGFADDKMAAIAAQWKAARRAQNLPDGWALFYINAHFDWPFFALHEQMEAHPVWAVQANDAVSGKGKRLLLAPLYTRTQHFIKTGSGQTWETLRKEWRFL
jgi:hypothetical protein